MTPLTPQNTSDRFENSVTVDSAAANQPVGEKPTAEKASILWQESAQRSAQVAKIFRAAFAETATEFKQGRKVVAPLAKEVTRETAKTLKTQGKQASKTVAELWQQSKNDDITERVIQLVRALALATKNKLFPQVKHQTNKLDELLSDRYGSRYQSVKDQFEVVRTWYVVPEQTTPVTPSNGEPSDAATIEVESEVVS